MNVAVIGLGLIGGSMAKAFKKAGNRIFAFDKDETIIEFARLNGDVDFTVDKSNISKCDLIILSLYPKASIEFLNDYSDKLGEKNIVIDCCGTKELICKCGFENAEKYGFTFIGGHPMAGTHYSGYKYSSADMFKGAPMVIVPPKYDDIELLDRIKKLLEPCNFGKFSVTDAKSHDKMISFTSQMPHIVSNAFIKSPTAQKHNGFSAGSYKDLTRVAWLNPVMWSDLFFENKKNLINELDVFINNLNEYKKALESDDEESMIKLLEDGKKAKEKVDG